jgi:hypothetical protein
MSHHTALKQCGASQVGGHTHVCKHRFLLAEILVHQLLNCVYCQYSHSAVVGTFHWDLWPGAWCIPGYGTQVPDVRAIRVLPPNSSLQAGPHHKLIIRPTLGSDIVVPVLATLTLTTRQSSL